MMPAGVLAAVHEYGQPTERSIGSKLKIKGTAAGTPSHTSYSENRTNLFSCAITRVPCPRISSKSANPERPPVQDEFEPRSHHWTRWTSPPKRLNATR